MMNVKELIKRKITDSDPIIFMLDGKEAYEVYPEFRRTGRFSNGYVVHCLEFK